MMDHKKKNIPKHGIGMKTVRSKFGFKGRIKIRPTKNDDIVLITVDHNDHNCKQMLPEMRIGSFKHEYTYGKYPTAWINLGRSMENLQLIYFYYDTQKNQIVTLEENPDLNLYSHFDL